jgi:AraC-like DNA-binding protein
MTHRRRTIDPAAQVQRGVALQDSPAYDWFAQRGTVVKGPFPFRVFADTARGGGLEIARIWHTPTSLTRAVSVGTSDGLTVLIQVEGDAHITLPDGQSPMPVGSMALIPDGVAYELSSDGPVARVEIRLRRTAGLIPSGDARLRSESPYIRVLLATINAALSASPVDPTGPGFAHMEVATGHLIAAITSSPTSTTAWSTDPDMPANLRRSEAALFARAKAVIERDSTDADFRVTGLAAELQVSPAYLRRVFARAGTSPLREIREARVRTALTLLAESAGADVERVARLAGFPSARRMRETIAERQNTKPHPTGATIFDLTDLLDETDLEGRELSG